MRKEEIMLSRLMNCTIGNGYDGLDEFKSFAQENPAPALQIAWNVLTYREDPGRDDGSLCVELLETVTAAAGRAAVENLILAEWPNLSDAIRHNITVGACNAGAMSTELALQLFEHPGSRVEQRHLIVAGLAAGASDRKCERIIFDLAKRIGSYPEPHRQRILEGFVQDVVRNYG